MRWHPSPQQMPQELAFLASVRRWGCSAHGTTSDLLLLIDVQLSHTNLAIEHSRYFDENWFHRKTRSAPRRPKINEYGCLVVDDFLLEVALGQLNDAGVGYLAYTILRMKSAKRVPRLFPCWSS